MFAPAVTVTAAIGICRARFAGLYVSASAAERLRPPTIGIIAPCYHARQALCRCLPIRCRIRTTVYGHRLLALWASTTAAAANWTFAVGLCMQCAAEVVAASSITVRYDWAAAPWA